MKTTIIVADYQDEKHEKDLVYLLDCYARDPMGGNSPLPCETKQALCKALANVSGAFSIIAYVDGQPVGLVNCLESFSTFNCRPVINIHDVVVLESFRGRGISRQMFEQVEHIARDRNACKLTLEVLTGNETARAAYQRFGFADYVLEPGQGGALFWEKKL